MEKILERFIKYVKIDTTSSEETGTLPSTEGQRVLAQILKNELEELGVSEVSVTDDCFVLARIPASAGHESAKTVGLLAHLDTAPDCSGKDVKPMIHKNYNGGVLQLEHGITIDPDTDHATEVGIGLAAFGGYRVPAGNICSIDVFTGPYYGIAINQHQTVSGHHRFDLFNKSSLRWRFGLGLNVWRLTVGAYFDLSMLKIENTPWSQNERESNVVSVGIGYNF